MNRPPSRLATRRATGPLASLGRVRMAPCVRRGCRAVGLASLVFPWTAGSPACRAPDDLPDSLLNRPRVNGKRIVFPVPGGVTLADGRFANFLPVRVVADLDVQAHIVAPSITYGITNGFDLNATLPLLRTSLDVTTHTQVPDPRFPTFALPPGNPNAQVASRSASADDVGIGDLLLRAKWVPLLGDWV